MNENLNFLIQERPVGTSSNNKVLDIIETKLMKMGYEIKSIPFNCNIWKRGNSSIKIGNNEFIIEPSPFSLSFTGNKKLYIAENVDDLNKLECKDGILFLHGKITQTPMSPKNYPFYYPEEQEKVIKILENKQPSAIIAVTGKSSFNGKNPFPFFDDGNFLIPSANISEITYESIVDIINNGISIAQVTIDSLKENSNSRQIIASKKQKNTKGKIIIGAHMDSKYDTPGALDNAAGVAVLLEVAKSLETFAYDIDIVPFNTEEYYGANGELEYLKLIDNEKIDLMINIDSPCHKNSQTAVSFYNFNDTLQTISDDLIQSSNKIEKGNEWYAGDHVPFVFRKLPCIAMTSSDFFNGALEYTHTIYDSIETIEEELIEYSAKYLIDLISKFDIMP